MSKPLVRWLTRYGSEGASSRYRVIQYIDLPALRIYDHEHSPMAQSGSSYARRAAGVGRRVIATRDRSADLCVVQKELVMPPFLWRAAALAERITAPIAWDVDDAVWVGRRGALQAAVWMANRADIVVAGNDLIADWATSVGSRVVTVIPTTFSPGPAMTMPRNTSTGVRIVWVGSASTTPLLDSYESLLGALLRQHPGLEIELVGADPKCRVSSLQRVTTTTWSPRSEHQALSNADYGLALQERNPYNDHKCGFKVVQYLSYGVVPIVTENPVHRAIASGIGHFIPSIQKAQSAELAERVAASPTDSERAEARNRWSKQFSTVVGASMWATVLSAL